MRSGLKQRCNGNFLAIFAGVSIGEKPNFTGRFFKWRKPFDNITSRVEQNKSENKRAKRERKIGDYMTKRGDI